jgi:splicing factor U2AF subunit
VVRAPDQSFIQQLLADKQLAQNQSVTRQARRLYVGNLPVNMMLSDLQLTALFSYASKQLGITTPRAVVSAWMSNEGTFAFVEYRRVVDCTTALQVLQGLQVSGRTLRVGRPVDYLAPPAALQDFEVPIGYAAASASAAATAAAKAKYIAAPTQANLTALSLATAAAARDARAFDESCDADAPPSEMLLQLLPLTNVPQLVAIVEMANRAADAGGSEAAAGAAAAAGAGAVDAAVRVVPTSVIMLENMISADEVADRDVRNRALKCWLCASMISNRSHSHML